MFEPPRSFSVLNAVRPADIPDILKPYSRKGLNLLETRYHPDKTADERLHECCKYIHALKDCMAVAGCTTVADLCAAQHPEVRRIKQDVLRKEAECAIEIARARSRPIGATQSPRPRDDLESAMPQQQPIGLRAGVAIEPAAAAVIPSTRPSKRRPRGRPPKHHVWDPSRGYISQQDDRLRDVLRSMPRSYVAKVRRMLAAGLFSDKNDIRGVTDETVNDFVIRAFGDLGKQRGRDYRAAFHWCRQHLRSSAASGPLDTSRSLK